MRLFRDRPRRVLPPRGHPAVVDLHAPELGDGAFNGEWLLPLIGVILLPYTTLTYILLFQFLDGQVVGFAWFFVALAFVIDIAAWFGGARSGYQSRQAG